MKYLELNFQAELQGERSDLPPFLGATLRGALGYVLKEAVCQVRNTPCQACYLRNVCPYVSVFEGLAPEGREILRKYPHIPQPFVLVLPASAEGREESSQLAWGVRLFGEGTRFWPYVVHAFRMIGERGLGKQKIPYRLSHITDALTGSNVWTPETDDWQDPVTRSASESRREELSFGESTLIWKFETPVKLKTAGAVSALDIVLAGHRRQRILQHFYGEPEELETSHAYVESDQFRTEYSHLRPFQLRRFSGRQQRSMALHGLVGEIAITGPWAATGDWLQQIPILHLGKSTSFGFGKITWETREISS